MNKYQLNEFEFNTAMEGFTSMYNFVKYNDACMCGTFRVQLMNNKWIEIECSCKPNGDIPFTLSKRVFVIHDSYDDFFAIEVVEPQNSLIRSVATRTLLRKEEYSINSL
jgi:hypothetical protein